MLRPPLRWLRVVGLAFFVLLIICARPARAQDEAAMEQLKILRDAVRDIIATKLTNGESTRGPSGPMMELLKNSGDLVCGSWLITFHVALRDASLRGVDPAILGQLQDLKWKIEKACTVFTDPAAPGPGAGPKDGPKDGPKEGPKAGPKKPEDGPGARKRPDVPMEVEICERRCAEPYGEFLAAVRRAEKIEARAKILRADADATQKAADDWDTTLKNAEASKQAAIAEAKKPRDAAHASELVRLNEQIRRDSDTLERGKTEAPLAREKAAKAAEVARTAEAQLKDARAEVDKARDAYEACLKKCYAEAELAKPKTTPKDGPTDGPAAGPKKTPGTTIGLRTGLALPFGAVAAGAAIGDQYNAMIPIQFDGGYRINSHFYVGAYFSYGIVLRADKSCGGASTCSASNVRFGLDGEYRIDPDAVYHPWVGLGLGYEISSSTTSAAGGDATSSVGGLEFVHVQGGADFALAPGLTLGPLLSFSLGQYSTTSFSTASASTSGSINDKRLHEWLTLGARGRFDVF